MGNAPSIAELPPEWDDILPNITQDDIILSSRNKCKVVVRPPSQDDDKNNDKSSSCVYLNDDIFDLDDDDHVPTALAILRSYPHLKDIRFKLVPGKMTEERYWAALFGILHDGGIDNIEELVGKIDDDYETGDEADAIINDDGQMTEQEHGEKEKQLGRTPIAKLERAYYEETNIDNNNDNADNTELLKEIKAQQAHIDRLQKSLREANHKTRKLALELHKERKKKHVDEGGVRVNEEEGTKGTCSRCNSLLSPSSETPNPQHTGEWEVHPDCAEFMKLDDHLKDNLRQEKQKRLNEVLLQMKFILDTDDVKDSYGKWTCCGKEEYDADGCLA